MRALIGVGARVEVILCLATGGAANPSGIARLTGYRPRTMQLLLQGMLLSGQVFASETSGRTKGSGKGVSRRYQMKEEDWRFLIGGQRLPLWTTWTPLWSLVCTVVNALPAAGEADKHPAVVSSKIRERLAIDGEGLAASGTESLQGLELSLPQLLRSL